MLEKAVAHLEAMAQANQMVFGMQADVSKAADVQMFADAAIRQLGRVDILVNNAGIAGPFGTIESVDWNEWIHAIEVNLLGSVLTCRALLPHFKNASRGKIIQLSGGGATSPMPMLSAYAVSKAAIIRFVETLAEETRAHHIDVNAISPGALNTRMLDQFIAAGPERIGADFHARSRRVKQEGGVPLARGADLAVFLGSEHSNGITGKLLSAIWDPWECLPDHLAELQATDIYTLRRILPKDRDMTWGGVE
jgi:3-oxoacyl-[acyl-carrier protein] reductase